MKRFIILCFCFFLPGRLISLLVGYIAGKRLPQSFLEFIIKLYCRRYGVNTDDIRYPDEGFKTFDEFFTRKLKDGVRTVDGEKEAVVSPVDGRVEQFGEISACTMIQAKGIDYLLSELIPDDHMNRYFINGFYITLYLSPADYHRIHSPLDGKVAGYSYYPGKKFPVRPYVVNSIRGLYSRNERLISYISCGCGLAAVCKVGAMNVGKITLSCGGPVAPDLRKKSGTFLYQNDTGTSVQKGDELGIFHLGSTVILLFMKDRIKFEDLCPGQKVRFGQRIAVMTGNENNIKTRV